VLGYTQAFSSLGGLMVATANGLCVTYAASLPALTGFLGLGGNLPDPHAAWRYTLMTGVIPAIPVILIRPFLPESPVWKAKRAAGTLKRPSIAAIFAPELRRTTIVTTLMFAFSFGAAFGAIQQMPRMIPGLVGASAPVAAEREGAGDGSARAQEMAPAEKKALSSLTHPPTAAVPSAAVFHMASVAQVPLGATPAPAAVSLPSQYKSARALPDVVELSLEDSGPGLSDTIRRRLFEPLMTTKARGIGLGLPLVKRILERHGGSITYAPIRSGARFLLRLPLVPQGDAHATLPTAR
jgi:hypothetical protein